MSNEQDLKDFANQCFQEMTELAIGHKQKAREVITKGEARIQQLEAATYKRLQQNERRDYYAEAQEYFRGMND